MALPGFRKYFKKSSDEERGHAEKLMKYQNMRGGRIVLKAIEVILIYFKWLVYFLLLLRIQKVLFAYNCNM